MEGASTMFDDDEEEDGGILGMFSGLDLDRYDDE
jgi:hypothetical protein